MKSYCHTKMYQIRPKKPAKICSMTWYSRDLPQKHLCLSISHRTKWTRKDKPENVSPLAIQQTNMESLNQHIKALFQLTHTNYQEDLESVM